VAPVAQYPVPSETTKIVLDDWRAYGTTRALIALPLLPTEMLAAFVSSRTTGAR
jgi:hypothetical protein